MNLNLNSLNNQECIVNFLEVPIIRSLKDLQNMSYEKLEEYIQTIKTYQTTITPTTERIKFYQLTCIMVAADEMEKVYL